MLALARLPRLRRIAVKRLVPVAVLAAVVVGVLAFALGASGSATKNSSSCYPGNEFTADAAGMPNGPGGAFTGESQGQAFPGGTQLDWKMKVEVTGNNGAAFTYSAGTMSGSLTAKWKTKGHPKAVFESTCIAEARIITDDTGDAEIEAEFEGTLKHPLWGGPGTPAVVTAAIETDGAGGSGRIVAAKLEASKGTTCFESTDPFEFSYKGTLEFDAKSPTGTLTTTPTLNPAGEGRSRVGLPSPFTATNVCDDVN
jgi:hypothetical protein